MRTTGGGSAALLLYLLIPHIVWTSSWRFLHGNQTEHLEEMILHDIPTSKNKNRNQALLGLYIQRLCFSLSVTGSSPDYTKVIKVSSTALSAKRLLEGENHTSHIVPVPDGSKDAITKPERTKSTSQ